MMPPQPPPGQGPVDPRGAFSQPPPPPAGSSGFPQPAPAPGGAGMYPPPPVMMMPPPYFPPPPARGGTFARAIFMTLATSIFGLSIAVNIYFLLTSALFSGSEALKQTILVNGDSQQKVAVVPINGEIDDALADRFDSIMRKLDDESGIKALVLQINTPGGSVTASDEIYDRIRKFKEDKRVPVVVAMGSLGTSGGYFISCAADQIVAERTTITGNIGVFMDRLDVTKLADKYGVEDTSIFPTTAPYKPMGSPLYPMTPMEHDYWLGLIDDAYSTFKTVVNTGRKGKLTAGMDVIANGRAYTSAESLKLGLIDQQGYASDAYALAGRLASLSKMQVVRYEPVLPSLFSALSGSSELPAKPGSVTINGINVNLDGHLLSDLATPRLMYLWRGN